jgi:hypothetical protein
MGFFQVIWYLYAQLDKTCVHRCTVGRRNNRSPSRHKVWGVG